MRNCLLLLCITLMLSGVMSAQPQCVIPPPTTKCGPPSYPCACTDDATVAQLPNPLPSMGQGATGVNAAWGDVNIPPQGWAFPEAQYSRLTDVNDAIFFGGGYSTPLNMGDGGNAGFISANETMFFYVMNGSKRPIKRLSRTSVGSPFKATQTPVYFATPVLFDQSTDDQLWSLGGPALSVSNTQTCSANANGGNATSALGLWSTKLDFSPSFSCVSTLVYDFLADANLQLPQTGVTWTGSFQGSLDGTQISVPISFTGNQETGVYIVTYNVPSKNAQALNTQLWTVVSDTNPVPSPIAVNGFINGTTGDTFGIFLHDSSQTANSEFGHFAFDNCHDISTGSNYSCSGTGIWDVVKNNVTECGTWPFTSPFCDGHDSKGYNVMAAGKNYTLHPYLTPNQPTYQLIVNPLPQKLDQHGSWPQQFGALDTLPAFAFTTETDQTGALLAPPPNWNLYQNEVVGFDASGNGIVYREGFNWNSGLSETQDPKTGTWHPAFACDNAIGHVSNKGNIAIFVSDGWGSFGDQLGHQTCSDATLGTCRCEILAITLK